jgi:AcrR family transcriptional regulator
MMGRMAHVDRLWRTQVRSSRGRPPTLDTQRVMEAAVAIADREGIAKTTLPRVARALGVTTMSLYRHVGSKDEFLLLLRETASGRPPAVARSTGWRRALGDWALADRANYRRHPWLAQLPVTGPPVGPNQVAWMEAALGALAPTGLTWSEKLGVLLLVSGYTRQAVLLSGELAAARGARKLSAADAERRYAQTLSRVIDPATFPETAAMLASGIFDPSSPGRRRSSAASSPSTDEDDYLFGLERILDGVEAAVGRRTRKRRRRA